MDEQTSKDKTSKDRDLKGQAFDFFCSGRAVL